MTNLEKRTRDLMSELHSNPLQKWNSVEIRKIVDTILSAENVNMTMETPIVKIAHHYDIKVYQRAMKSNISAMLLINGKVQKLYGNNKVIEVEKFLDLDCKRYMVAIELGKYIFDFLGSSKFKSDDVYIHQYMKKKKNDIEKALIFAKEILMPQNSFAKQYIIADNINRNKIFIIKYLSRFFNVPIYLVEDRIKDICYS